MMGGNSPLALNVGLYQLPYDPLRDFAPVSRVATQPNLFAAHPKSGVKSVAELVALSQAKPGFLLFASAGAGSGTHSKQAAPHPWATWPR